MRKPAYSDSVFINCPFDNKYSPLLRAMIYAVYRCGFYPITAMIEDNGLDNRIDKLKRLIENCRYGIHDISRIQLNSNKLPRFNMPFELGLFFGASKFGSSKQKSKNALIMEGTKYLYQQYLSDINGIDTKAHNNDPMQAIRLIRNWLNVVSRRATLPSDQILIAEYRRFLAALPKIAKASGFKLNRIPVNDYCIMAEYFIQKQI